MPAVTLDSTLRGGTPSHARCPWYICSDGEGGREGRELRCCHGLRTHRSMQERWAKKARSTRMPGNHVTLNQAETRLESLLPTPAHMLRPHLEQHDPKAVHVGRLAQLALSQQLWWHVGHCEGRAGTRKWTAQRAAQ